MGRLLSNVNGGTKVVVYGVGDLGGTNCHGSKGWFYGRLDVDTVILMGYRQVRYQAT
jgi:hypothetical protein